MEIKNVALVIRKTEDGGVLIFGKGLDIPKELIDNAEHLVLGHLTIDDKHIFHEYKLDAGNTPDRMLNSGALHHGNYKHKLK